MPSGPAHSRKSRKMPNSLNWANFNKFSNKFFPLQSEIPIAIEIIACMIENIAKAAYFFVQRVKRFYWIEKFKEWRDKFIILGKPSKTDENCWRDVINF